MDNKQFWKTIMTLFSDKRRFSEKITLVEVDKIFTEHAVKREILNTFFSDTFKT